MAHFLSGRFGLLFCVYNCGGLVDGDVLWMDGVQGVSEKVKSRSLALLISNIVSQACYMLPCLLLNARITERWWSKR